MDDRLTGQFTPEAQSTSPTRSLEKGEDDVQVEKATDEASSVGQKEVFEWREVFRGSSSRADGAKKVFADLYPLGIFEIQVWLTGMAYFGLIVSLYSYSLFL